MAFRLTSTRSSVHFSDIISQVFSSNQTTSFHIKKKYSKISDMRNLREIQARLAALLNVFIKYKDDEKLLHSFTFHPKKKLFTMMKKSRNPCENVENSHLLKI
jgi:hypothetical protein